MERLRTIPEIPHYTSDYARLLRKHRTEINRAGLDKARRAWYTGLHWEAYHAKKVKAEIQKAETLKCQLDGAPVGR